MRCYCAYVPSICPYLALGCLQSELESTDSIQSLNPLIPILFRQRFFNLSVFLESNHLQDPDAVGQGQKSTLLISKQGGGILRSHLEKHWNKLLEHKSCRDTKVQKYSQKVV